MVTKATSDLNHFNNQTNGASPVLSEPSTADPVNMSEALTNDPEASGYERKKRMPFPRGTQSVGSLIHFSQWRTTRFTPGCSRDRLDEGERFHVTLFVQTSLEGISHVCDVSRQGTCSGTGASNVGTALYR
jgi:hypothetical protein